MPQGVDELKGGAQLYLTDASLCDNLPRSEHVVIAAAVADAWKSGALYRVEARVETAGGAAAALKDAANSSMAIRCGVTPDQVRGIAEGSAAGVTLWLDSVGALARRSAPGSRPPGVMRMARAIRTAREKQFEVVVAFPFEPDRLRSVLHLGYLLQSHGVDRIRLVELSGRIHPLDLFRALRSLRERLDITIELDVSDECGLAAGAALCAIRAGIRHLVVSSAPDPDRRHLPLNALLACVYGSVEME